MGSPNFTHDTIMKRTFGCEIETDDEYESGMFSEKLDEITERLSNIDNELFETTIEQGYHSGFVIHSQSRGSNYIIAGESKEWMLDEMHALLQTQIKDIDLLQGFVDGTNEDVIREENCFCDNGCTCADYEPPRSREMMYLLAVINRATESYTQFKWVLDSHVDVLITAFEEAGVKLTSDSDVEALAVNIDEALDPKALREAVSECIEKNIENLENDVVLIAQEFNLKELVGVTWTSHLTEVDYDELLEES